jgi:hypothetical protein
VTGRGFGRSVQDLLLQKEALDIVDVEMGEFVGFDDEQSQGGKGESEDNDDEDEDEEALS